MTPRSSPGRATRHRTDRLHRLSGCIFSMINCTTVSKLVDSLGTQSQFFQDLFSVFSEQRGSASHVPYASSDDRRTYHRNVGFSICEFLNLSYCANLRIGDNLIERLNRSTCNTFTGEPCHAIFSIELCSSTSNQVRDQRLVFKSRPASRIVDPLSTPPPRARDNIFPTSHH